MVDWNHSEEKWEYFDARIRALTTEEAKQSPKLKQLLECQVSDMEAVDDG